jgi:predicted molibdopterin-dependent oxidoreductase YjgC
MERGYHKRVGTYFQQPLDSDFQEPFNCEFCGACIDICPVGALNSKMRKFRGRTWEGHTTASVCPFCSVGCLLKLQVKEGELVRTVPAVGPNNEDQACFRGRFGTDYVNSTSRLITPLLRRNGEQAPVDSEEALRVAAEKISAAGRAEAIVSSSLTGEEIAAAAGFVEAVLPGAALAAVDTLGLEEPPHLDSRPWEDLEKADLIVVAGQDFTVFQPVAGVRLRVTRGKTGAGLVVLDPRDALLGREADLWLRPPGEGLAHLLGGLLRTLGESHGERLKGEIGEDLRGFFPPEDNAGVEKRLGLPPGSLDALAEKVTAGGKTVFVGHRGWFDATGALPRLLAELDRLLSGEEGKAVYLGRDCNSLGASREARGAGSGEETPDLLLLFGADPLGTALPGSPLRKKLAGASTVIVFDTYATETGRVADILFPLPHFAEKEGSFISSSGLRQALGRAMVSPPGVVPLADSLARLAAVLGKEIAVPAESGERRAGGAPASPGSLPPGPEERCLVLCGSPVADHRVRLVAESEQLFPGSRLEVHPSSLPDLGLEDGDTVRLTSGEGGVARRVRADLKVPPGKLHLPCDPSDAELRAFVEQAVSPPEWPPTMLRLDGVEKIATEQEESR